jgi:hypothetical protein
MAHKKAKTHVKVTGSSPNISLMVCGRQKHSHLTVYLGQSNTVSDIESHITGSTHGGWVHGHV